MKQGPVMLMLGGLILTTTIVASQTTQQPSQRSHQKAKKMANRNPVEARGQKVFEQNCSRCHNTPEGFPTNISGTVATHMRVRAGLSEADYQALLRYLNP